MNQTKRLVGVLSIVMVLALSGCSSRLGTPPSDVAEVAAEASAVPSVVGMKGDDARDTLEDAGFEVEFDAGEDFVVMASNWTVDVQTPEAGATAPEGATITLAVSKPEPTAEPEPEAAPAPETPRVPQQPFNGTGDSVIDIALNGLPAVVTFDCPACDGNTVLKTNGSESLLVNEIGAWNGQYLIDTRQGSMTTTLTISATGDWAILVDDITTVPQVSGPASGTGDRVVAMTDEFDRAAITNNGESNFVVYGFGGGSIDLAVNTIGGYSGTVPLVGPGFVEVKSSGDWTITPG